MRNKQKNLNPLAARLVEVRKFMELGQEEFAALMGATYRSYQRYEQGSFAPKMAHLAKLCDAGISVDWLLTGDGPMHVERGGAAASGLDGELIARLVDGLLGLLQIDSRSSEPESIGQHVARLYPRLAPIADEGERRGALRYALEQLRDELRVGLDGHHHPRSDP